MSARRGSIVPALLLGSIILIFTLGALSFTQNFSQKRQNQQITQNSEVDQFPGWKTYANKNHNFTIRYPRQWFVVEYGDYAADFLASNLGEQEASPTAVQIRYLQSSEPADIKEFEKIHKLKDNQKILEPLDVESWLTKIKNFKIGGYEAIDFQIERNFTAPVGPKKEFSRIYEINKDGVILKFSTSAQTLEEQIRFNDSTLPQVLSTITFK